ncbi:MAG: thioredoxin family protein [Planctomycetota bacterium]|nr:thioredoxin family protein [Planctomycetota bacterium]
MNYAALFTAGLPYQQFLQQYGTDEHRRRWENFHQQITLTDAQIQLLKSFTRDMKALVLAGAWCGDCVNQCPIFEHFATQTPRLHIRYLDRDAHPEFAKSLSICGGARVPMVVFLSEDDLACGWAGDRTLSKYRNMAGSLEGTTCPTGLIPDSEHLTAAVVQDWLNEFERIQWMLRTSSRLRQKHGD